mgnify:CR=1 FL=1
MERTEEALRERVRETPLNERLKACEEYIASMCAERRPPKMTIPLQHYDEDFYIYTTLADAQATIAALQARVQELEQWVQDQSTTNLETMRHMDEMQSRAMDAEYQLTRRTAELERVRGERDEYAHKTKMLCLQNGPLMIENHDMKKLIAALPKVEGSVVVSNGYVKDSARCHALFGADEDAASYAALLKHRQGMEG